MVKALHRAGIEVILDVVYNHTAEGNHLGPMLSFRGVDNESYYRLVPENPRFYMDYTGRATRSTRCTRRVLRLIMDSLRYFVTECHVDGFRFDLASALAREFYEVDRLSAFFDIIHQDPILSQVKLIAEPWDVGPGGYQVGNFPILWSEWNGIYRDTMRDFWRGQAPRAATSPRASAARPTSTRPTAAGRSRRSTSSPRTTASRCATSSRTTRSTTRRTARTTTTAPTTTARGTAASRDRPTTRRSTRCARGSSGTSSTTLLLSQGVPMLLGGDECGRTQRGNNNAWCQDNEISWFDWDECDAELLAFSRAADRAAPRASGLPAHEVLRGQGRAAARRVVDAPRRSAHDAARLGQHRVARDRRLPQRRRVAAPRRRTAKRCATTRSSCSSTRTSRTSPSACPRAGSARAGRSCSRRAASRATASPRARTSLRRDALDRRVAPCLVAWPSFARPIACS